VPPDDLDIPVRQRDDPLAVVLGEREDKGTADFLDLSADPHDSLVQVEIFQRQAEQLAFPHPTGGG
jgi:hypothetical protein